MRTDLHFAALKAMQLGEFTSFRGVTSKSDSIFAGERRFRLCSLPEPVRRYRYEDIVITGFGRK